MSECDAFRADGLALGGHKRDCADDVVDVARSHRDLGPGQLYLRGRQKVADDDD